MDILIYSMSAEMSNGYSQPKTARNINDDAQTWRKDFASLSKDELFDIAVSRTRMHMQHMNWAEDDIEGVAWFLGIYTHVILKSGLINGSFADIIMPCMRKYFNLK